MIRVVIDIVKHLRAVHMALVALSVSVSTVSLGVITASDPLQVDLQDLRSELQYIKEHGTFQVRDSIVSSMIYDSLLKSAETLIVRQLGVDRLVLQDEDRIIESFVPDVVAEWQADSMGRGSRWQFLSEQSTLEEYLNFRDTRTFLFKCFSGVKFDQLHSVSGMSNDRDSPGTYVHATLDNIDTLSHCINATLFGYNRHNALETCFRFEQGDDRILSLSKTGQDLLGNAIIEVLPTIKSMSLGSAEQWAKREFENSLSNITFDLMGARVPALWMVHLWPLLVVFSMAYVRWMVYRLRSILEENSRLQLEPIPLHLVGWLGASDKIGVFLSLYISLTILPAITTLLVYAAVGALGASQYVGAVLIFLLGSSVSLSCMATARISSHIWREETSQGTAEADEERTSDHGDMEIMPQPSDDGENSIEQDKSR